MVLMMAAMLDVGGSNISHILHVDPATHYSIAKFRSMKSTGFAHFLDDMHNIQES